MALEIIGTVVGKGLNPQTGKNVVTIQCNATTIPGGFIYLNANLPTVNTNLSIGQSVWLAIILSAAERTTQLGATPALVLDPVSTVD